MNYTMERKFKQWW